MSLSLITRKFTVEEYEKMTTQGIIKPDEKVELIFEEKLSKCHRWEPVMLLV